MKSIILVLLAVITFYSCSLDCQKVDCFSDFGAILKVTYRDEMQNLLLSKKIDPTQIRVFHLDSASPIPIEDLIFIDSIFIIELDQPFRKLNIAFPPSGTSTLASSHDIEITYEKIESDCCPNIDQLVAVRSTDGVTLNPSGVLVLTQYCR
jgi:hypothetical protein